MVDKGDFALWLEANPAPDLQQLVAEYGGYNKIPAWRNDQWQADYQDWLERYRRRHREEYRLT
jgi:hypothetical protein